MRIGTLISGLLLVLVGVILLLINFGYGSWSSFYVISKCWPILLILIGLGFFWRGRIPRWIAYLIIIFSVGAVGAYMTLADQTKPNNEINSKSTINILRQQYPQVKEANLSLDYGGGKLLISPGISSLFQADFSNKQLQQRIEATEQNLQIFLIQKQYTWTPQQQSLNRWQLKISPELAWKLDIDAGAIDGNIDLNGVPLRELNCNLGAGNMLFILGNNGANSKIKIEAGASNVKLRIAKNTGVRIKFDGALNANNLDELGWIKSGSYYSSPNYQQATSKINCDIKLSAGNLDVKL